MNNVKGEITVNPVGTAVSPADRPIRHDAGRTRISTTVIGHDHRLPEPRRRRQPGTIPELRPGRPDVPEGQLAPADGNVGSGGQAELRQRGSNCSGTFQGETVSGVSDDIQQQFYTSDPLASVPLVATSVNPAAGRSFPALGSTGSFSITFQHTAVDKNHVVLIRDSGSFGPGTGNRTRSIYCGNSPGQGAAALENAIKDGCAKDLALKHAPGLVLARAAPVGEPVGLRPARAGPEDRRSPGPGGAVPVHAQQLAEPSGR